RETMLVDLWHVLMADGQDSAEEETVLAMAAEMFGVSPDRLSVLKGGDTAPTSTTPKGYWIAHGRVDDPEAYEAYRAANAAPLAEYGGRFLVRGGVQEVPEGTAKPRTVLIEFPSYAAARACYASPGYQEALKLRLGIAESDLVIVEGYLP
ncbi:MAG: DUF1330 domain-containing protein, partial [Shimia sp.]